MFHSLRLIKAGALAILLASTINVKADTLFSNWATSVVGGALYTAGGPCSIASCFAIADNFRSDDIWAVTGVTVYVVSFPSVIQGGNWRYALFTSAGVSIIPPTNAAVVFTDLGAYPGTQFNVYKGVISGLNTVIPPGDYELRFTNTQSQGVFPAYGSGASPQSIAPGFVQLTGSSSVESLLSTDRTQRDEEWAFEVTGTTAPLFANGFDSP
ncbi:MAG: hypothetical protein ABIP56_07650 [Dokdonella sp.]